MRFYNNKSPYTAEKDPLEKGFSRVKEPPLWAQMVLYFLLAAIAITAIYFFKKYVLHTYTRDKVSFLDFDLFTFLKALITIIVGRLFFRALSYAGKGFSSHFAAGYTVFPPSIYVDYEAPLSKFRRILTFLAPFLGITIWALVVLKLKRKPVGLFYPLEVLYINAAFSCEDLYNAILTARAPKGSETLYYKKGLYENVGEAKQLPPPKAQLPMPQDKMVATEEQTRMTEAEPPAEPLDGK